MELPLHPLVVHAAVVLVPLAAIFVVLALSIRRARTTLGAVAASLSVAGAVSFFVAWRTGTMLAEQIGTPEEHLQWGDPALIAAISFAVLTTAWFVVHLLARTRTGLRRLTPILAVLAVIGAVGACVFTYLVGHSGAEAAWLDRVA